MGGYFGAASDQLADRLPGEQLEDGGWNCEAPKSRRSSFHTTICVLEGLLAHEKAKVASAAVTDTRTRGSEVDELLVSGDLAVGRAAWS